jgi:hypothetical protein
LLAYIDVTKSGVPVELFTVSGIAPAVPLALVYAGPTTKNAAPV